MKLPSVKVLYAVGIVLLVLIAVVMAAASVFLSPDAVVAQLSTAVSQATGRKLTIAGDPKVSFFPWLGVDFSEVSLTNAKGFGNTPFAKIGRVEARVKLLPLLGKKVQMKTIVLDGLVLNLARDKTGKFNWSDMAKAKTAGAEKTPETAESAELPIAALGLGGLDVRNARIGWNDLQTGKHYTLENLNLKANSPTLNLKDQSYQVPLDLSALIKGKGIPGGQTELKFSGDMSADLKAQTANLAKLNLALAGLTLQGEAQVKELNSAAPGFDATIALKSDDLQKLLQAEEIQAQLKALNQTENARLLKSLRVDGKVSGNTRKLALEPLNLKTQLGGDPKTTGTLDLSVEGQKLEVDLANKTASLPGTGHIKLHAENARKLLILLKLSEQAKLLDRLDLDAQLKGNLQQIDIQPLSLQASLSDETMPKGHLDVDLKSEKLSLNLDKLKARDIAGGLPALNGKLKITGADLHPLFKALKQPDLAAVINSLNLETSFAGSTQKLSLKPVNLQAALTPETGGKGRIEANLSSEQMDLDIGRLTNQDIAGAVPALNGKLQIKGSEMQGILKALKQTQLAQVFQNFDLNTAFAGSTQKLSFQPLNLKAQLASAGKAPGQMDVDLKGQRVEVDLAKLKAKEFGGALPVVNADLQAQGSQLAGLLAAFGVKADAAKNLKTFQLSGRINGLAQKLAVEPLAIKATVAGEGVPKGAADLALNSRVDLDLARMGATLTDLRVKGLGLDLSGNATADKLTSKSEYKGLLKVAPFNLREFMTQLGQKPPVTADPKVLTRTAFDSAFSGTASSVKLSGLSLQLDDTKIKGDLAVTDFARKALDFKLAVDAIDADRYLAPSPDDANPPREEKPGKKTEKSVKAIADAEAKPVTPGAAAAAGGSQNDGMRNLNARGQLTVGKLKIGKLKTSNLNASLNAKDGFILIQPISADLYEGKYAGSVAIDAQTDTMKLTLDEDFQGVQAGKLLEDVQGKSRISGKANVNLKLTTAGRQASDYRKNLGGQVKLLFTNGAVKGINIGKLIRMAKQGVILPVEPEAETDFAELKGTLNIVKGVINNDDFDAKSPLFRFAGRGTVDLVQNQVDYVLDTTVSPTAEGQGGADLKDLRGFTIPIKITGPTNKPRFMPDLAAIAKQRASKEIEKQKGKLLEKVPGGKGLKELLKF